MLARLLFGDQFSTVRVFSESDHKPFVVRTYQLRVPEQLPISEEFTRIIDADTAGMLTALMHYKIAERSPLVWEFSVNRVELLSLLKNENDTQELHKVFLRTSFVQEDRKQYVSVEDGKVRVPDAIILIIAFPKDARISVNGKIVGTGEVCYEVEKDNTESLDIVIRDRRGFTAKQTVPIIGGMNQVVTIAKARMWELGPAGGYVFYDKGSYSDGWRYLEAAPAGWSGFYEDPCYEFGGYGTAIGETSFAIGSGKTNTQNIIQKLGNDNYAARAASEYSVMVDGVIYDNWFLPSKDELNKMYKLHQFGLGGFSDDLYGSSSEYRCIFRSS